MNKWKMMMAAAATATLVGCGGSVCDHMESTSKNLQPKFDACPSLSSEGSGTSTFSKAQCESGLTNCTEDDKKKIEEMLNCLDGLNKCVVGQEASFSFSFLACAGKLQGMSSTCTALSSSN